jgi:hypothetical protein
LLGNAETSADGTNASVGHAMLVPSQTS